MTPAAAWASVDVSTLALLFGLMVVSAQFQNGYVVIRSRFQRYIGRFVLHCHILSHEDAGMMLLVEIEMG